MISLGDFQFRVLVLQGFWKKNTTRPKGGVEIFFPKPEGRPTTLLDNRTRNYLCPMKSCWGLGGF